MKKRTKRHPAKLIVEGKCTAIVHYVCYPESGMRSERHGRCSRWTCSTCGLCRRHCAQARDISFHDCGVAWASAYRTTPAGKLIGKGAR